MKHNSKSKGPMKGLKRQHLEKNLNVVTYTKIDNNTQCCTVQGRKKKLRNDSKDLKLDSSSVRCDVSNHTVDNNSESLSTGCNNIRDSDLPTADTKNNSIIEFIRASLNNCYPSKAKTDMDWPTILLLHSEGSINVSEQDFKDLIYERTAEIITLKSNLASQMNCAAIYDEQQHYWIKKFENLSKDIKVMNDKLATLNRKPNPAIRHVRTVGTNVSMPENPVEHLRKRRKVNCWIVHT